MTKQTRLVISAGMIIGTAIALSVLSLITSFPALPIVVVALFAMAVIWIIK